MRVLHAHSGNLYGGVETVLVTLARCRDLAPGLDTRFAMCFDGKLANELRETGVEVEILGPVRFSRPWTVLSARRAFRRSLARWRPDVVICQASWPHAIFASEVRRAGLPLVFWQHDIVDGYRWTERFARRTLPDLVLVNSRATAELSAPIFPGIVPEVIYCPVIAPDPPADPPGLRAEVRRGLGTPDDRVVIVTTCRFEPYKGHTLLLDALGRLRDRPGWEAWIAGGAQRPHERDYLDALHRQAESSGVADRVRFLGQRSDIPRLLASSDIHCQPNLGPEPFGIAFIEAMNAGLPVVTTGIGGAVEIVTEACGVLVPPADPQALADVLTDLLTDPARRQALGEGGPARARQLCDPSAILGRLAELLNGLSVSPIGAAT